MRFFLPLSFSVLLAFGCGGQTGDDDPVSDSSTGGDSSASGSVGAGGSGIGTADDSNGCVTEKTYEWDERLWPKSENTTTSYDVFANVLGTYTAPLEYPESTAVVIGIGKPSTTIVISVTPADGALPRDVSGCETAGLVIEANVSIVSADGALSEYFQADFRADPEMPLNVTLEEAPFEPTGAMTLQTPSRTDYAEAALILRFKGEKDLAGFTVSEKLLSADGLELAGETLAAMGRPLEFERLWE